MGEKAVISNERHLKRWPPSSWIYYFSQFWSCVLVTWFISSSN